MKAMQKILALAAAGATVMSMAACGGSNGSSSADGNKLTISWWGNQQRNDRTKQVNDLFSKANDGVSVDGQFSEFADYWQKLSTNAAGKSLPDVMQMDMGYIQQYVDNGLLYDMSDFVKNGTIDLSDVDPNVAAAGQFDGKTYAVVNATNAPALIYDKTLLDGAGITVPDTMTVDDFISISKQVYEKTGVKTNIRYYEASEYMEYLLRAEGKTLLEKGKLGVDSASELEPYFQMYEQGIKEGWHIAPEVFADLKISSVEQDPLVYGTSPERMSWCTFKYSSQFGAYQKAATNGHELAMAAWPSDDVKKSNYVKPSQYWVISKTSKNPELAAKWINFYTNDVEANKILLTDRGLPISTKVLSAIKSDLSDADLAGLDFMENVVTPNSSTINPPSPAGSSEINSKILPSIEETLCYGKTDAAGAAQQFFDEANAALAKAK